MSNHHAKILKSVVLCLNNKPKYYVDACDSYDRSMTVFSHQPKNIRLVLIYFVLRLYLYQRNVILYYTLLVYSLHVGAYM